MSAAPRPDPALFVAVLAVAFALRIAGIDVGLPLAEAHPEETATAWQAVRLATGDLDPRAVALPSLHTWLSAALFGAWYSYGKLTGLFVGQEDLLRSFGEGAVALRMLMRGWSALMGTLGVALLFRFPGGRVAAPLYACSFVAVRDSHFGLADTTTATLAIAAVALCLPGAGAPSRPRLAAAGLVAGLATSAGLHAAPLVLPLALAAWGPTEGRGARLLLACAAMALGFFASTPSALFDPGAVLGELGTAARPLAEGTLVDLGPDWQRHALTLWQTQGWPFVLAAVSGLALSFRLDAPRALLVHAFPLASLLLLALGGGAPSRHLLPVLPFLCVAAGEALDRIGRVGLVAASTLVVAMTPFTSSLSAIRLLQAGDTRDRMGAWIEANVPNEEVLVHAGAQAGAPMLQRNAANRRREQLAAQAHAATAGLQGPDDERHYDPSRPRYDLWFVEKPGIELASRKSVEEVLDHPPRWLLVEASPLRVHSAVPQPILDLAATRYTALHVESAVDGPTQDPVFDQQDALYLPAANFEGFVAMGPTLTLYLRKDP